VSSREPPRGRPAPAADDESVTGDESTAVDQNGVDWDGLLSQLGEPQEEGWVTLEEASSATGVSRSTLRSWYRTGQLPSRMVAGIHGPQRLVPLEAVLDRGLRSSRVRRQLDHARSLEAEVEELRRRLDTIERYLGFD